MLPNYPPVSKTAKTADLGAFRRCHLGVLLESSEYEIKLPHTEFQSVTGQLEHCSVIIKNDRLKIITHETPTVVLQELTLHSPNHHQKISFFIVSNLFDLACNA